MTGRAEAERGSAMLWASGIILLIAGVFEVGWAVGLKYTEGFTRPIPTLLTAISLVAAGVGSAILPASTFHEGDRPGVRRIPLINPVVKRKVILTQRKNNTLSPAAEAFCQLVKAADYLT